ncbi:piwi-like 2, partial [Homarus americanus]
MRGRRESRQIVWTKPQTVEEKKGMAGKSIQLIANYFILNKAHSWKLCLYHVYYSPDEDRTRERKQLLRQHRELLGANYLFDGMLLYLAYKLGNETKLVSKRESDGSVYQLKIKFIKEVSSMETQFEQILNTILRRCQEFLGLQLIGRNYYNPKAASREERHKISIWPGFSTSIRQHEDSILLNADVLHKFLRTETAYELIERCKYNMKKEVDKLLLGAIVMTTYNDKTYRVDDVDWNLTPSSKFPYRGDEISYIDYYQKNYQVRIKDVKQPMLMSKPKKRDLRRGLGNIYLVPELCALTGLTDIMKSDFNMMKDLSKYMRMGPDKRVEALQRFNQDLSSNAKVMQEMEHWGLNLSPSLIRIQGRILPEEQILQDGRSICYNQQTSDWSKELRSLKFNLPVGLDNWAVVFPLKFATDARELLSSVQRVGAPMGMMIKNPAMFGLQGDSVHEYIGVFNQCVGKQLVLILLSNNRADRYNAVKRHLSIKMGIASQCILSRTLLKKQRLMSVATKVAIQINCKLGGEPWNIAIPLKNAMVIGYDTYHDKATRGQSYGAVVSSTNQTWTQYLSQVSCHSSQEELTNNFAAGIRNAINRYKVQNGFQPRMIVVYRDGVGEGQIEFVKEHEISAVKRSFQQLYETPPKFAFIIVTKRINTRFFVENRRGIINTPPGTVVDDVITFPERFVVYLLLLYAIQLNAIQSTLALRGPTFTRYPAETGMLTFRGVCTLLRGERRKQGAHKVAQSSKHYRVLHPPPTTAGPSQ